MWWDNRKTTNDPFILIQSAPGFSTYYSAANAGAMVNVVQRTICVVFRHPALVRRLALNHSRALTAMAETGCEYSTQNYIVYFSYRPSATGNSKLWLERGASFIALITSGGRMVKKHDVIMNYSEFMMSSWIIQKLCCRHELFIKSSTKSLTSIPPTRFIFSASQGKGTCSEERNIATKWNLWKTRAHTQHTHTTIHHRYEQQKESRKTELCRNIKSKNRW